MCCRNNFVYDRLAPFLWQDITGLEAVCYQIIRTISTEGSKLWSNNLKSEIGLSKSAA
jgi:hypothetical protein